MSKHRVLITGITGMVGSHLTDFLLENTDWDIYGLCRWRSPLDNLLHHLPRVNRSDRLFLLYGDIRDTISIERVVQNSKPNYVYHLAAQSYPLTSFDAPLDTLDTNVLGTTRLLEALRRHAPDALIHVCSSSEVFGRVSQDKLPIDEECGFHPASPYAISKVGTDLIGRFYAEAYGMMVLTTRMFTHTGPRRGDVFAESSFAKQIALAEAGHIHPIIKVGNLKSLRTISDVRDAVRAYYMLLTVNPRRGEFYNIGGSYSCEIGELLRVLLDMSSLGSTVKIEIDSSRLRPIDADLQVPNVSKFTQHTGWTPEIPFEDTMMDLLSYWRDRVAMEGGRVLIR